MSQKYNAHEIINARRGKCCLQSKGLFSVSSDRVLCMVHLLYDARGLSYFHQCRHPPERYSPSHIVPQMLTGTQCSNNSFFASILLFFDSLFHFLTSDVALINPDQRMIQHKHMKPNHLSTRRLIMHWDHPREIGLSQRCMQFAETHIEQPLWPMNMSTVARGIGMIMPCCKMLLHFCRRVTVRH